MPTDLVAALRGEDGDLFVKEAADMIEKLMAAAPLAVPAGFALVPVERSYDMRAAAIPHFNTVRQAGRDLDDALDAAWKATLAKAHHPADPLGLAPLAQQFNEAPTEALRPPVPGGWRVLPCTSSAKREADRWEVYSPCGSGGVVSTHDVRDWAVRELLDAIAASPETAENLDARMKQAGMFSVPELLAGAPLDRFIAHAGVKDLASLLQWAEMRRGECLRMQARYDLGEKDKNDELYEWTVAHCAVFTELHVNLRTALADHSAQDLDMVAPLHITHRPLIRNAIGLLSMRRPMAPDVERVVDALSAMLDGLPTPAGAASDAWLRVAELSEAQAAQQEQEQEQEQQP